ncbi:MAG: hypothetical protein DRO87_06530 [Candidatus Thorarchaeota archaeon]|nr:MAG: hypothetical protein DRO87_06530 [Candidatus Thorarchaeota archaeon]RLI58293.1 MAG: hypothetical protein DRP09_00730 [Candidatus Thorarchaeota archaeon]
MNNHGTGWWTRTALVASILLAWVMMLVTAQTFTTIIVSLSGIVGTLLIVVMIRHAHHPVRFFWDESMGVLVVFRSWTVEALSARLLSSVPLGIDVSYSGVRVLGAMNERYKKVKNATLSFFLCRPIGNSSTKVGMVCSRRLLMTGRPKAVDALKSLVHEDATLLESAMRASYPHTPVIRAELSDMQMIMSGGAAVHA